MKPSNRRRTKVEPDQRTPEERLREEAVWRYENYLDRVSKSINHLTWTAESMERTLQQYKERRYEFGDDRDVYRAGPAAMLIGSLLSEFAHLHSNMGLHHVLPDAVRLDEVEAAVRALVPPETFDTGLTASSAPSSGSSKRGSTASSTRPEKKPVGSSQQRRDKSGRKRKRGT